MKYKHLKAGDRVENGDEWFSPLNGWRATSTPGKIAGRIVRYRRPIKKKKGSK